MRTLRRVIKSIWFISWVAFFTIFFQTDYRVWRQLGGPDPRTGDVYCYEERTLRATAPGVYTVLFRVDGPSGKSARQLFEINLAERTIRNLETNGPPVLIPPGTAADLLCRRLSTPSGR